MSIIRILPAAVANRIAAGEVIERPASVVKELVENALDAQAGRVTVNIQDGGRRLIQVTDDGCGMDRDDALLCLEAHATSKIATTVDVGQIQTLGFRGEALPSIASVSRFNLQTCRPGDPVGTEVIIESGKLLDVRDCGCAPGTNVRVGHLFTNMPGRRKFLKGANTEEGHIQEIVNLQALAHPEIAFDLQAGGREILRVAKGTDLGTRIGMLMGRDALRAMLPVDYEEVGIRVTGYVAKPGFTRSARREQRIFVNQRPASAKTVYYALREAYHTLIMKGRYPPVVLYITLAPERVDVNVHPAKLEVRFREGRLISQVVAAGVRNALRGQLELSSSDTDLPSPPTIVGPARAFRLERGPEQAQLPLTELPPLPQRLENPVSDASPPTPLPGVTDATLPPRLPVSAPSSPDPTAPPPPLPQTLSSSREEITSLRIIGMFAGRFLVAEGTAGMVLIDQQAAHQRILFERMLAAAGEAGVIQQQLLIPITLDLGADDAKVLTANLAHFNRLGFGIEPFGGNTFLVVGVPASFPDENINGLLREILDDLRHGTGKTVHPDDVRIAQVACRCAVRRSDNLTAEECGQLLRDLAQAEMPYTCPNGQPVMVNFPLSELEKRFGGN